jgi:putative heme-binding domain-containing protein
MIRRIASEGTPEALELLVKELAGTKEVETQVLFLQGIQAALVGRRKVAMPRSWEGVYARLSASSNGEVRTRAKALAVTFGDPTALAQMRQLLQQEKTPLDERRGYLETLLAAGDKKLVPVLLDLLSRPPMRQEALRALASYDDPAIPKTILGLYASYTAGEKRDALMTLCSRDRFALALLDAIEAKKVPLNDVTADLVRQLRNLKDKEVVSKVGSMWVIRDTAEDKAKQIAHYKRLLQANPAREADLPQGRAVFAKTCQQCHRLFGTGGNVGPELTGANRGELDYLLSNILDPSALMGKDYLARVIETRRGRVVTGLIREETKNALTVVTGNDTIVLPRSEILEIQTSDKSMMPDDLLKPLSDEEVRVLVGYLQSRRQVPLLATPENAVHFFDGKDLLGWQGDPGSWKVEKGVLIGTANPKGDTLLINELLAEDFHLSLQVRPSANSAQPGIRFRGQVQPQGGVKGYSLDLSTGQLQEEGGRGLLASAREPVSLRANEWNRIDVTVAGSQIAASVNGKQVVQWDDPAGARAGVIALRVGAGQGEVQFKDLQLEVGKK